VQARVGIANGAEIEAGHVGESFLVAEYEIGRRSRLGEIVGDSKVIDEHQLFLASHAELTAILRWLNHPTFLVERGAMDNEALSHLWDGDTVILTRANSGITTTRHGLSDETVKKVVETFCESHLRLK
jgi:hypothetical protein